MIEHHAQALTMAALVPKRSDRPEILSLAERVRISQESEISLMKHWLERRNVTVEAPHVHAAGPEAALPGMLTTEDLRQLSGLNGREFERLFLELMTRHHEGAITMVRALFKTPGAGQDGELFIFASAVDADQRAEITRMKALLVKL